MKYIPHTVVLVAFTGVLIYTNPTIKNYEEFVAQEFKEEMLKQEDPLVNMFGSLFGGFAIDLILQRTIRHDYVLFSTYDTVFDKEHFKAVGFLKNFTVTERPNFKRNGQF
jgi:hypothetical protein